MSVYQDLNNEWQEEWMEESKSLSKGDQYLEMKALFLNNKIEDLKVSDLAKYNQYCGDFASVQRKKQLIWSIANAGVLGVGVGLAAVALFGAVSVASPLFLGAIATVIVTKAITYVKNKRYSLATTIIDVLRGQKKEIKYYKAATNKDESSIRRLTRGEFLASGDYPTLVRKAQIPPAVGQYFMDEYNPDLDVVDVTPISVTQTEWTPYAPATIQPEEQKPKVDAGKWVRLLAPIVVMLLSAYVNSGSSKQSLPTPVKSPISSQKSEMAL